MNFLAVIGLSLGALTGSFTDKDPLVESINAKVIQKIETSEDLPGLRSEKFNAIRSSIRENWDALVENGVVEITGSDKEIRPVFLALQAIVEQTLTYESDKELFSLTGVIHTPMPATPLCFSRRETNVNIEDPFLSFVARARAKIIRSFLSHGGALYIVYPKDGVKKRTESQRLIYKKELQHHADNLFDRPLDCDFIEDNLIGAFYLFKDQQGKVFGFAVQMGQTGCQDEGNYGLWFGEVKGQPIEARISTIVDEVLKFSPFPINLPL